VYLLPQVEFSKAAVGGDAIVVEALHITSPHVVNVYTKALLQEKWVSLFGDIGLFYGNVRLFVCDALVHAHPLSQHTSSTGILGLF